jgi:hypothetical protein
MAVVSSAEQRVILRGISWETYERLLAEHQEEGAVHFTSPTTPERSRAIGT